MLCCLGFGQKAKTQHWDVQAISVESSRVTGRTPSDILPIQQDVDRIKMQTYKAQTIKLVGQGYEPFAASNVNLFTDSDGVVYVRSEVWFRKLQ